MDDKIVPIGFINRTCAVCGSKLYEKTVDGGKIVEMALPYATRFYCKKCNKEYYIASYITDGKIYPYASCIDREGMMFDRFYKLTQDSYREVSFGGWVYAFPGY